MPAVLTLRLEQSDVLIRKGCPSYEVENGGVKLPNCISTNLIPSSICVRVRSMVRVMLSLLKS